MARPLRSVADQTLDELEGVVWGPPTYDSYVAIHTHRLRQVPLKQYRLEDLRLMIGQGVGLEYLVPRALDHLEKHPLASGVHYRGDLLSAVVQVSDGFWATHRTLIPRVLHAIEAALARVHKVETDDSVPDMLREARTRLLDLQQEVDDGG